MHRFLTNNGVDHEPEIAQYCAEEGDLESEEYLAKYLEASTSFSNSNALSMSYQLYREYQQFSDNITTLVR